MRQTTFILITAFLLQTIFPPEVLAARPAIEDQIEDYIVQINERLAEEDSRLLDEHKNPVTPEAFRNGIKKFSVQTPDVEYKVSLNEIKSSVSFNVVAVDASSGKVIGRRKIEMDPKERDAEAVKLRVVQTAHSLDKQIAKHFEVNASLFKRLRTGLEGLFSIPSAHAGGLSSDDLIIIAIAIGFLSVFTVGMLLSSEKSDVKAICIAGFAVFSVVMGGLFKWISTLKPAYLFENYDYVSPRRGKSSPSGYRRNPGYDYVPSHARGYVPEYVPADSYDKD